MLIPKKTIWKKPHRVSYEGYAKGCKKIEFGEFGLQALEGNWITNNQIESARIALMKHVKKYGKLWIRIFPHFAKTSKPIQVRMGSGKGSVDKWVAVVKRGTVIFEISGISEEMAKAAVRSAGNKLPIRWRFVKKGNEMSITK